MAKAAEAVEAAIAQKLDAHTAASASRAPSSSLLSRKLHEFPQWVQDWEGGDPRELLPYVDVIDNDGEIAERLFADRQDAFNVGLALGSTLMDIKLRGLAAVQADEERETAEMLRWLEQIRQTSDEPATLRPTA